MTKLLKVYFWIFVVCAAFSVVVVAYLVPSDPEVFLLPAAWILIGHTLLFPVHGFLYAHGLPFEWFWCIWTPVVIVLGMAGILGTIQIGNSIQLKLPAIGVFEIVELVLHAPVFAMSALYLIKPGGNSRHQPNKGFNRTPEGPGPAKAG